MDLKKSFESHFLIWGCSLAIGGFVAGASVPGFLAAKIFGAAPKTCVLEGLERTEQTHGARLTALQGQLTSFESKASDQNNITSYQDKYKESAERIRRDIEVENKNYQSAIERLSMKCK